MKSRLTGFAYPVKIRNFRTFTCQTSYLMNGSTASGRTSVLELRQSVQELYIRGWLIHNTKVPIDRPTISVRARQSSMSGESASCMVCVSTVFHDLGPYVGLSVPLPWSVCRSQCSTTLVRMSVSVFHYLGPYVGRESAINHKQLDSNA